MARTSSLSFSPFAVSAGAGFVLAPTYAISANATSIYEGEGTVGYTITTTSVGDGTTLYYTIEQVGNTVNTSSFVDAAMSGSFTITSNQGSFAKQSAMEVNTTNDVFRVHIRTDSISGPIVATSANCTIIDLTTYNAALAIYETGYGGLTISATAGAPGNGALGTSAQNSPGANGRSSSATFQGVTITATGGRGGNSYSNIGRAAGGTGSGGTVNVTGGEGGGPFTSTTTLNGSGGGGVGGSGGVLASGTTRAGNGAPATIFGGTGFGGSTSGGLGGTPTSRNGGTGGTAGGGGGGAFGANSNITTAPIAGQGQAGGGGGGGVSVSRTGQVALRGNGARGGGGRVYISYSPGVINVTLGNETSNTDISNTYTIPSGTRDLKIWVVGGGGGGGTGATTTNTTAGGAGGGAGGGSYRQWLYANAAPTKPPLT